MMNPDPNPFCLCSLGTPLCPKNFSKKSLRGSSSPPKGESKRKGPPFTTFMELIFTTLGPAASASPLNEQGQFWDGCAIAIDCSEMDIVPSIKIAPKKTIQLLLPHFIFVPPVHCAFNHRSPAKVWVKTCISRTNPRVTSLRSFFRRMEIHFSSFFDTFSTLFLSPGF